MSKFLYSVEREFDATVDQMWHAWTDAAALEEWYCPTDLKVVRGSVVSDLRVGGWWTVGVDAEAYGFVAYFFGTYSEVVDKSRLVHTLNYTQDADEFAARVETPDHHVIEIDIEARGDKTWARFGQIGVLPEGEPARAKAGMESYFDNLEAFLSR